MYSIFFTLCTFQLLFFTIAMMKCFTWLYTKTDYYFERLLFQKSFWFQLFTYVAISYHCPLYLRSNFLRRGIQNLTNILWECHFGNFLVLFTVLTVPHIANHYNNFETLNNMSVATKFRYVQKWLTFKILLDDILGADVCFYIRDIHMCNK